MRVPDTVGRFYMVEPEMAVLACARALRAPRAAKSGWPKAGNNVTATATDVVDAEYFASVLVVASRRPEGPVSQHLDGALARRASHIAAPRVELGFMRRKSGAVFEQTRLLLGGHNHPCIDGLDSERFDAIALAREAYCEELTTRNVSLTRQSGV